MLAASWSGCQPPAIPGQQWEKVTLSFDGPATGERAVDNPFLNYRLDVTFRQGDRTLVVPGFYAADGQAAESGDSTGGVWLVRFRPDAPGLWTYTVSFRQGPGVAAADDAGAGEAVAFDGQQGQLDIAPAAAGAEGKIRRVQGHYLQYAGSGRYFLKGGADSPENFLAYVDFDGTYRVKRDAARPGEADPQASLHRYEAHLADWRTGDPVWRGDKGRGIIGALNYLAGKGMNSVYFLTMNIGGDGRDVWPYTSYTERLRFDCSKLDQWELVFDHMDRLGLMLHVVTQETENEKLLDDGDTGTERKLYYRELVARFGHHLGVTWNMGEENGPANFSPNGQSLSQQQAMVAHMQSLDPWDNPVVIHTHAWDSLRRAQFDRLLGDRNLDGPSIQVGQAEDTHAETRRWIAASAAAGHPWVVCVDEIGPANRGVDPDDRADNNQDLVRQQVLWGNLMAGGAGVEWYFGYENAHNDLSCEDWRSRDRMWDYTRHALAFFQNHLPFHEMAAADERVGGAAAYVLAKPGDGCAVYLPQGGAATLDLSGYAGEYEVHWYDPRRGGALQAGSIVQVTGGGPVDLGMPPADPGADWAVWVRRIP
ncbi:MAG: hypothetical protein OHK0039_45430 [Bacteroidia bacterium]